MKPQSLEEVLLGIAGEYSDDGVQYDWSKEEIAEAKQAINTLILEQIIGEDESDNGYDKIIERMIKDKQRARIR